MEINEDFRSLAEESLGRDAAGALLNSLSRAGEDAVTSIRFNPAKRAADCKCCPDNSGGCLGTALEQVQSTPIPWCEDGLYIDKRINFTLDPMLHSGCYYVQDASSMFLSLLRPYLEKIEPDGKVLDLCAAPGGKSTHLISLVSAVCKDKCGTSGIPAAERVNSLPLIVVNEAVRKRVPPLCDNMARWGAANVLVTNNFAKDFNRLGINFFDLILADVPCSGEGMFRKSQDAIDGWSLSSVRECAKLQRDIIADIWPTLREGGILVYSTCTYNHFENADNVAYIASELGAEILALGDDKVAEVTGLLKIGIAGSYGYQFVPGLVAGEGQFFAVLRKSSELRHGDDPQCGDDLPDYEALRTMDFRLHAGRRPGSSGDFKSGRMQRPGGRGIPDRNRGYKEIQLKEFTANGADCSKSLRGYRFYLKDNQIFALLQHIAPQMLSVADSLNLRMCGISVGNIKGADLIPDADFALSQMLLPCVAGLKTNDRISISFSNGAELEFLIADVCSNQALKFLARQDISLLGSVCGDGAPCAVAKGYVLVTYKGSPLGFVKNLGNRCNNLYPLGRRILNLR